MDFLLLGRNGGGSHCARDKSTIKRLQMYSKGGKVTRSAEITSLTCLGANCICAMCI